LAVVSLKTVIEKSMRKLVMALKILIIMSITGNHFCRSERPRCVKAISVQFFLNMQIKYFPDIYCIRLYCDTCMLFSGVWGQMGLQKKWYDSSNQCMKMQGLRCGAAKVGKIMIFLSLLRSQQPISCTGC